LIQEHGQGAHGILVRLLANALPIILGIRIDHPNHDPLIGKFSAEFAELGDALARNRATVTREEQNHRARVSPVQLVVLPMVIEQGKIRHLRLKRGARRAGR
jgi:hypothetical protein